MYGEMQAPDKGRGNGRRGGPLGGGLLAASEAGRANTFLIWRSGCRSGGVDGGKKLERGG